MKTTLLTLAIIATFYTAAPKAAEEPNWRCIQDNNNFIIFYPFKGYWAIITDKTIQGAKRAEGITTGSTTKITSAVVQNAPQGTSKQIWTSGAIDNNLTAYLEPLCYY